MKKLICFLVIAFATLGALAQTNVMQTGLEFLKIDNADRIAAECKAKGYKLSSVSSAATAVYCLDPNCMGPIMEIKYNPQTKGVNNVTIYGLKNAKDIKKELKSMEFEKTGTGTIKIVGGNEIKAEIWCHKATTCYVGKDSDGVRLVMMKE